MGLRLVTSEIVGSVNQMRTGMQEISQSYSNALQVIQDFSSNEEFKSVSWNTAKSNIFEAHQSIISGSVVLNNMIDADLGKLKESIGCEDLDEDALLLEIQRLEEECEFYENMIIRFTALQAILPIGTLTSMISLYQMLLIKTQLTLAVMKSKLESLKEKAAVTALLFVTAEGLIKALEGAIQDAEFFITGQGVPSNQNWKDIILEYVQEDIYTQLINEENFENMGIDMDKMKEEYGENVITEIRECMKEFGITDKTSIAMFLATMAIESDYGRARLEYGDGGATYTEAVKGAGLLQITGGTQKQFLTDLLEIESDPELRRKAEQYLEGFSEYGKNAYGNNTAEIDGQKCAEFIAEEYPVYSSVWFWKECPKYNYSCKTEERGKSESTNDFIERMSEKAKNIDNLFLFVQMRHNGTVYYSERLEEMCNYSEDAVVVPGCVRNKETEHYTDTDYCFTIPGEPERHSNGPFHWKERKAAWDTIKGEIN